MIKLRRVASCYDKVVELLNSASEVETSGELKFGAILTFGGSTKIEMKIEHGWSLRPTSKFTKKSPTNPFIMSFNVGLRGLCLWPRDKKSIK